MAQKPARAFPVPFIVGSPRSGTTLVRAMLEAHPDIGIPGESHFIPRLRTLRSRYERRSGFDVPRFCRDLAGDRYFQAWGLEPDAVRDRLRAHSPGTVEEAIRETFLTYALAHGKTRWGDKTPAYVLQIRTLATMFPEARFIHLVRDGRDVARSLIDVGWASSIEDAALRWAFRVRKGREAGLALGPARYLEVRYEELLEDTEAVLDDICRFIELPYDQRMTQPQRGARTVLATLTNPKNHQRLHLPPTQVRNWREEMSPHELLRFEAVAGGALASLGYARTTSATPLPTLLAVTARRTVSLPGRVTSRVRRMTWIG